MTSSSAPEELGEKIKRPMNAFILWSRERRRELANEDPNMHNFEISKRLGMEWNRLDAKDKKQFYDEAQKLKEEHRKNYPDYKYHPRRKPRRRFTPINQSPTHFQMTYFLPPEKRYPCPPGYSTFPRNHWFTNLPSIPSSSAEILHNQLEMRYYPQSHLVVNGAVPIPTGYYGIRDIPAALSAPLQQRNDELPRAGSLMKREELLRRAAESSLEYRMQGKDETIERSLETNRHAVKYHDTSGFHRQVSPTHVCLGCQGVTTFYQGIRSPAAVSS